MVFRDKLDREADWFVDVTIGGFEVEDNVERPELAGMGLRGGRVGEEVMNGSFVGTFCGEGLYGE